ncbi:MAG: AraC family transcriptional regulator [Rhizobacter sp.]
MAYLAHPAVHSERAGGVAAPVQNTAPVRIFRQARSATASALQCLPSASMVRQEFVVYIGLDGAELSVETDGRGLPAGCAIVSPCVRHRVRAVAGTSRFVQLAVNPRHPGYRALRVFIDTPVVRLDPARFDELHPRLEAMFAASDMHDYKFTLLVDDILDAVLPGQLPPPPQDERIREVLRRIDANIDHPFEQLVREIGLSPSRFSHLVSEQLGLSLRGYKLWRRADVAWEIVFAKPQWRLARVASEAGFSDQSHMSRTMLQSFGFTASQLRDPLLVQVVYNW